MPECGYQDIGNVSQPTVQAVFYESMSKAYETKIAITRDQTVLMLANLRKENQDFQIKIDQLVSRHQSTHRYLECILRAYTCLVDRFQMCVRERKHKSI